MPNSRDPDRQDDESAGKKSGPVSRGRRGPRPGPDVGLERIAEVHTCRSDEEANQYLALGPEWDLQDIIPARVETPEGQERDEVHYVVARWETDQDRARLRTRDRGFSSRSKKSQ